MLSIHLVGWPMRSRSSAVVLADLLVQRQCGLPHKHPVGGVGILLPFCTPKPWTAASFLGVHLYEGLGTHCERGHALCMHGSRVVGLNGERHAWGA